MFKNLCYRKNNKFSNFYAHQLYLRHKYCTQNRNQEPKIPDELQPHQSTNIQDGTNKIEESSEKIVGGVAEMSWKENQKIEDEKVDKLFTSDQEIVNKKKRSKYHMGMLWLGLVLAGAAFAIYHYVGAFSDHLIESFWVPEEQFRELTNSEVLLRLQYFGQFLEFPVTRHNIFEQEWPLMMAIQSLRSKDIEVRKAALSLLTKMADYDEFRAAIIAKKINFSKIIMEAMEHQKYSMTRDGHMNPSITDEIPYLGFISQFLDQKNVQNIALKNGYYFVLESMLNMEDMTARCLALISLAKLASNPEFNKLMANRGVFNIVMQYSGPNNVIMHNDGTRIKFKAIEASYIILKELYNGPNQHILLENINPAKKKEIPLYLNNLERSSTEPYLLGQHIFQCAAGSALISIPWGFLRFIVAQRFLKKPFQLVELKNALKKGSGRAVLGSFLFVWIFQCSRLANDKYLQDNKSRYVQTFSQTSQVMLAYIGFLISQRFFPYAFLPTVITILNTHWPTKVWDSIGKDFGLTDLSVQRLQEDIRSTQNKS